MPPNDLTGHLRDVTPDAPKQAIFDTLGAHRAALQAIDADVSAKTRTLSERIEAAERMAGETAANFAKLKSAERSEWVAEGGPSELDSRYLNADGSVRFLPTKVRLALPGLPEDMSDTLPGLLTEDAPVTPQHARLVQAFRAYVLVKHLHRQAPEASALLTKTSREFMRALQNLPGRVGQFCRQMVADPAMWTRVLNSTTGTGGEFISNPTLSMIRRPLILQRRIPALIRTETVANSTFKQPIVAGHGLMRKRGKTVTDPARYPDQAFTTSDASVSTVDMAINALLDPNWIRDAAPVMADPIGEVNNWLAQAWVDTQEAAYLHGDTAGTHEDTLSTWTLLGYFSTGQLDGVDSPLKLWLGIRARAFDDSNTASGSGSFTAATHYAAVSALGNHASSAVMATGLSCFYNSILANSIFTSYNAMGPAGTLLTGKLGAVGQNEIIISEFMPKEFDTSSGLYTGSNKGNEILYFDPTAWVYYELADGSTDYDVVYPERGARYIGMTARGVLVCNVVSTEKPAYVLYNT